MIAENVRRIRERIGEAACRCGRSAESVRLVGVCKYVDAAATRALFEAGCHDLGESRPQQLWDKAELLADLPVRWHMIGHLQRNKVKRTIACQALLHSIDSERLAQAVEQSAEQQQITVQGLLEVNVSGDPTKHGVAIRDAREVLEAIASQCRRLTVVGLMTMASLQGGPSQARRDFQSLRMLRERLLPHHPGLSELSMGMSGDFEQAIEEGATIVRIGSALFE